MNPGQEQFYHFFMQRVRTGKEEEAKALLNAGFEKQANGTFNTAHLDAVMPKYFALIQPEFAEDLDKAMKYFRSNLN